MRNTNCCEQFSMCINDLINSPSVRSMSEIPQHLYVNCLEHSIFVSYVSFLICRYLGLDFEAGARGGLLHDLFLYDWRKHKVKKRYHLFSHPKAALKNASEICNLSDVEKDIISKHMWPLTLRFPKYKESYVVSFADKFCAVVEMLFIYKYFNIKNKFEMSI